MKRLLPMALVTVLVLGGAGVAHGDALPEPDPARVKTDLDYLCSADLAGRETGTVGAAKAAAYLAQKMQEAGAVPVRIGGFGGVTPYHFPWRYSGTFGVGHGPVWGEQASDVVGEIPGGDPLLAAEYVFVTAHFDHLGSSFGTLYPGADDDASGSAGLLELIRLMRDANPRRTIVFLAASGEEEGLLGSEAFLAARPLPMSDIKADINLDMIGRGRKGELHVMPARRQGYVTTLTRDARNLASAQDITLSAGIEPYWRDSDHYSFARRAIPSICFNTGLHEDYHQPSDTPDKINYPGLAKVLRVVLELVLKTANADTAPEVLPAEEWQKWTWGPYRSPNDRPAVAAGKEIQALKPVRVLWKKAM